MVERVCEGGSVVEGGSLLIMVGVDGRDAKDPWIRVMASNGVDGWTQVSRLMELD